MIAGFEETTGGAITLDGIPIHGRPPARRNVAMAFEAYSLYPPLTIGEKHCVALKIRPSPAAERTKRVRRSPRCLKLPTLSTATHPRCQAESSSAQARARACEARRTLSLDEPMGQLEPQLRSILRGRIKHFCASMAARRSSSPTTRPKANAIADRIAVMEEGVLQQYATPAELKNARQCVRRHIHRRTADECLSAETAERRWPV